MEQLDSLLQLIAHLQDDSNNIHGRQFLLEHARTSSGARLALLFRLDAERRQLHLLARNGRRPRNVSEQQSLENIPLHGSFGTVLDTHGLLSIPDLHSDTRSLPEERYRAWPGGLVVVCAVGKDGMLVLCFAPQKQKAIDDNTKHSPAFDESTIRICASLLSNYLTDEPAHLRPAASSSPINTSPSASNVLQFEAAIDRERERIARDIHDGPAQQIASVLHRLEYIERTLIKRPQEAMREIGWARQNLNEGMQDLRQCITALIPLQLQHHSLSEALRALQRDDENLRIDIEMSNSTSVPATLENTIYRFVQEALTNVRKHAQARRAIVRVRLLPGQLLVEVSDDGKGFDSKTSLHTDALKVEHLGLRIMRDRVREAGGSWKIDSTPGAGTTVCARFPLTAYATPTIAATSATSLTSRERDVLRLVIDGLTNRAIAEQLSVSTETVKTHVHHIMQKMNAKDRTHAAVLATRQHQV